MEDPNEQVALCSSCLTVIPDSQAEKDVFYQAGKPGVCPYCKGPFHIVSRWQVEGMKAKARAGKIIG